MITTNKKTIDNIGKKLTQDNTVSLFSFTKEERKRFIIETKRYVGVSIGAGVDKKFFKLNDLVATPLILEFASDVLDLLIDFKIYRKKNPEFDLCILETFNAELVEIKDIGILESV